MTARAHAATKEEGRRGRVLARLGALALLAVLPAAVAQPADPPPNFAAAFAARTLAYRPAGSSWGGSPDDFGLTAGLGRFVTKTVALELDLGPTWVGGDYSSFSLVPGVVWAFSPHAYLAARFPITVDPETTAYAAPGAGLSHTFASGLTPIVEVNLVARLGHGRPDLGLTLTLGLLYSF